MYNSDVKIVPANYLRRARTCQNCFLKSVSLIQNQIKNTRLEAQIDCVWCRVCGQDLFREPNSRMHVNFVKSTQTCAPCHFARWKNNELQAQVDGMLDDQQLMGDRVVEKQQITTFAQDEEVIEHVKDEIPFAPAWNNHAQDLLIHDVKAVLQRPLVISSGRLAPALSFTPLAMPDALIAASSNLRAKIAWFGYLRANLKFKLVFNATPFMSGKYLLWFSPMEGYSNRPISTALSTRTGFPCVELDVAKGSSIELKVPYCAPLSHYNLTNGQSYMGKLHLDVITGTLEGSSPSLGPPYTLYAWFEDIQISMPASIQSTTFPTPPLLAQIAVEESVQLGKPKLSAIAGGVATTAKLFSGIIPRWLPFLRPVEWVSRALSGAASAVGMNKPIDLRPSCPVYNLPGKGFTNMDGDDGGVVLGAAPDNSLTLPKGLFSTDVDEMDLGYVVKNSCICTAEKSWTTSNLAGDVLLTFPVTPGYCTGVSPNINATTLAFVSSIFERWTGGLRYRLAVSKTAFHSGRLRITYHPSYFDSTLASTTLENAYNWVLDLSVSSDIDFVVPYVSNTQWKDVRLGGEADNEAATWNFEVSTGIVSVTVMTQLVAANNAAASSAPFYLWISAAEDFSLAVPSNPRYCPLNFNPTEIILEEEIANDDENVLEAQIWNETSKDAAVNQEDQDISQNLFPKAPIDPTLPEQVCIGEKISNLRQVIKRFCKISEGLSSPYPNEAGTDYSYPGVLPKTGSTLIRNAVSIDPAFLGTNVATYTNSRSNVLGAKYFVEVVAMPTPHQELVSRPAVVSQFFQSQALLHYLSFIYTFWTGSKRYKLFVGQNSAQFPTSGTLRSVDGSTTLLNDAFIPRPRTQIPYRVFRDTDVINNGIISPPGTVQIAAGSDRVDGRFESVVYPDLDGCVEFTVPYYSKLPISLVAQGTLNSNRGTLVSRNLVQVSKGFNAQDSISPFFSVAVETDTYATYTGRTAEDIGTYTLYEAAGDDFSFGYLRGAPTLQNTRAFV